MVAVLNPQALVLPEVGTPYFEVTVEMNGTPRTLSLWTHSVRGPEIVALKHGIDGKLERFEPSAPATYRGRVEGWPESLVAASLTSRGLEALILSTPNEVSWAIEPIEPTKRDPRLLHAVFEEVEVPPFPQICGNSDRHDLAISRPLAWPAGAGMPRTGGLLVAEIAWDADFLFYSLRGGGTTQGTIDAVESILNTVGVIYEYYLDLTYEVSGFVIRTSSDPLVDPYYALSSGSPGALLAAFRDEWGANQTGIQRDIAHLFAGIHTNPQVAGMAYYNGICHSTKGYGFTLARSSYISNVVICSHELGHNWGAFHCDTQPTGCGIMFSTLSNLVFFAPSTISRIASLLPNYTCLLSGTPSVAPTLSAVIPGQVQVLDGGTMTLQGNDLDQVLFVHSEGTTMNLGQLTVVDENTITYDALRGDALGWSDVHVSGPGGDSSTVSFEYVETDPPKIVLEGGGFISPGHDATWTFGGLVGKTAKLLMSRTSTTVDVGGFYVLADGGLYPLPTLAADLLGQRVVLLGQHRHRALGEVDLFERVERVRFAGALAVETLTDARGDLVQPGHRARPPLELIPLPPRLQVRLLHEVLGFFGTGTELATQRVEQRPVLLDQLRHGDLSRRFFQLLFTHRTPQPIRCAVGRQIGGHFRENSSISGR